MDILVTGANGFIGRHLCRRLAGRHRVYALARTPCERLPNLEWVAADLTSPNFEMTLPDHVDAVIALAQSRYYRDFPDRAADVFEVNVRSLLRLLEWGRRRRIARFLYASSANVYAMDQQPITEQAPLAPSTFYAQTKLTGEMLVEGFADYFSGVVLRLFTVYGPGQAGMLVPQLIERIGQGQAVRIEGEQGIQLSPLFVGDLCHVVEAALQLQPCRPAYEVLNVGGDDRVTIRSLAELIGRTLGQPATFEYVPGPPPRGWMADCSRLRARLAPPPFVPLAEGIRRTVHAILHRHAA